MNETGILSNSGSVAGTTIWIESSDPAWGLESGVWNLGSGRSAGQGFTGQRGSPAGRLNCSGSGPGNSHDVVGNSTPAHTLFGFGEQVLVFVGTDSDAVTDSAISLFASDDERFKAQ